MLHNIRIYKSEKMRSGGNEISPAGRLRIMISLLVCGFLCFLSYGTVYAQDIYSPVDAVILFRCVNSDNIVDNKYRITIKTENSDAPMPQNDTVNVNDSGEGSFTIRITEPGTYDYLIYQIKGDDEKINYDSTVYEVHVFVISNEDNELGYSVAVNIADTDQKPEMMEFKNIAFYPGPDTEASTEERTTEQTTESTTEITTEASTDKDTEEETTTVSETKEKKTDVNSAKTGDASNVAVLAVLMLISSVMVAIIYKKKNREQ